MVLPKRDTLTGDANANFLLGGAGADSLSGGDGDDVLMADMATHTDAMAWTSASPTGDVKVAMSDQRADMMFGSEVSRATVTFDNAGGDTYLRVRVTAMRGGAAVGSMVLEGYGSSISLSADFGDGVTFDSLEFQRIYEDFWTEKPYVESFDPAMTIAAGIL